MARLKLEGNFAAIVTPFRDGRIDEKRFAQQIERQIRAGVSGLVPCGTTGESATLTHEEHDRVIELTIRFARGRVPVMAGTGSNSTEEAIRLTRKAANAGADCALLIAPYYNKPTQAGLVEHYRAIARAVKIPLVVYNIPGRTGINIQPQTLAKLADVKNIAGLKDASGSLDYISELTALTGSRFAVLAGDDSLTLPMMSLGATGVICASSNVLPAEYSQLCKFAIAGKYEQARKLHHRIYPLTKALFAETNPIAVKAAMELMGLDSGDLRLPLYPASKATRDLLKNELKKLGKLGTKGGK